MTARVYPVPISFLLPINKEKSLERFVNVYLVVGEQVCLVDTGVAGSQQTIVDALAALGKSLSDVRWVVNTHEHPDHIGGNSFFQEAAQPHFACHPEAVRWVENLDLQYEERPMFGFYELAGKPIRVTHRLQDGEKIDLGGGTTLQAIFTPGHSPGSVSLFCPQDGSLMTGDLIPPSGGLPLYVDVAQLRQSLQRLAALSDVKILYDAHAEKPSTGPDIATTIQAGLDYLDQVDTLAAQVVHDLPADAMPEEITHEVFVRLGVTPPPVTPTTVTSIMAHLN